MAILIILTILLMYLNLNSIFKNKFNSLLVSICFTFLYLYLVTEVFSIFNLINQVSIIISWFAINVILLIIFALRFNKLKKFDLKKIKLSKLSIIFVLLSLALIVLSIKTIPYNWDSMTYHLPRITHWIQNGSINHYSTNIIRQLASPIFAEVVDMHVYLLSNSTDIFINLLQTFSFIMNSIIVYFIARKLGCSKTFSFIALFLTFSMPIGFAEALTTQVDNFAALWCLIFTYFILDFMDKKEKLVLTKENVLKLICLGITLGFGYLTKPTVLISCIIFTLYLFIICLIRKDKALLLIKSVGVVLIVTVSLILPTTLRNLKTFNAINAPITGSKQMIHTSNSKYFFINFLKNWFFNYPTTMIEKTDTLFFEKVKDLASKLNVNINDVSISENGIDYSIPMNLRYHHDYAINPLIMWLLSITLISYIVYILKLKIKDKGKINIESYVVISVLSFIIFLSIMRFQVWETRYEISFLCLLCPVIAYICNKVLNKEKSQYFVAGIILFLSIISLHNQFIYHSNMSKVDGNRVTGYFKSGGPLDQFMDISKIINQEHYNNIGLEITEDTYEYPLWMMLKNVKRIEHVNVKNETRKYKDNSFIPDAIISNNSYKKKLVKFNDIKYIKVFTADEFNLFIKK